MGMYTGLRCKVMVHERFAPIIEEMMNEQWTWEEMAVRFPEHEVFRTFSAYERANAIPYSGLSYMPDEWETIPRKEDGSEDWFNGVPTDGFDRKFDSQTRLWSFQCSLKNYQSEIEGFFETILPLIVEEVLHLEYYYEEWDESTFYELKDGTIVESEKPGICYVDRDSIWYQ